MSFTVSATNVDRDQMVAVVESLSRP